MEKTRNSRFQKKNERKAFYDRTQNESKFAQIIISGSIFVLLVSVKLFLPEQLAVIRTPITGLLERNMDVTAAFAAVGRAISESATGEETLGRVYQAVFGSQSVADPAADLDDNGNGVVYDSVLQQREANRDAMVVYTNENIPNHVQLQQEVLGFDYCAPLEGFVTSYFGYRAHPTEDEERFHYGLDITSETNPDILSFADGVVTVVGESSSYGKYLMISHENTCTTLYAHCERIHVKSGQTVKKGEKIAKVGESGMATGPHLHFELQKDGVYLNPVYYVF